MLRGERAPDSAEEARAALIELARRRSGRMPAELLVDQALRAAEGTDWPTRRAALDALLRRLGFAQRDGLVIAERPAAGAVLGRYRLASGADPRSSKASQSKGPRPYQTSVYALSPVQVSCDCADFVRSSLGLCKHSLVVLEELVASPRHWRQGLEQQRAPERQLPELCWDWLRPWTGQGDRLAGLRWRPAGAAASSGPEPWRAVIERGFAADQPEAAALAEPERRLALLEALHEALAAGAVLAEPAAQAIVRDELESARRRAAGRAAAPAALAQLGSLKRTLYPYQLEGLQRLLAEQRLLLADDMGLGKTTQAIAACHALYASGRVRRGLLIVPAPLKTQWQREWLATTDQVPLSLVDGSKPERERLYRQTERGFLILHYEQLLRDLEPVQRFAPELVVLDEAQRIKNWTTKSYSYVTSLSPEWRLVLTGTPLENRLEELATLLDWIDDSALAPKWRLGPWHTEWSAEGSARIGARHLETLRQRAGHCLLRRIRREVLQQLPPRTDARVPIEMTEQQREEHDARTVPIAQLMQLARRRPLRAPEFLKLMQLLAQQRIISNGMAQLRFAEVWPVYSQAVADEALLSTSGSPKLLELRRLLGELAITQGRKVVVFSQWRKMLRLAHWAVAGLLEAQGLRAVFFTGEESQRQRTQNVADFHDDASVRVMFLSDAGGVGLNLQHAASACINLELPWNPAVLEQRVGRIYRLGQTQPIDVFHLVSEYGIEARIAGLLGSKEALFTGLFDGTTDSVRFDTPSSFVKDLERLVEHVELPPADGDTEVTGADADVAERADADVAESADAAAEPALGEPQAVQAAEQRATPAAGPSAPPLRVDALFERIRVTRTANGGLRLDAEPEAADELARLLQGLAALLSTASKP